MPERHARERLREWRDADRIEGATQDGSVAQRRASATTRRARWAYEDAARNAGTDQGGPIETPDELSHRLLRRLAEAMDNAAGLGSGANGAGASPESDEQRDKRLADDEEIGRELRE